MGLSTWRRKTESMVIRISNFDDTDFSATYTVVSEKPGEDTSVFKVRIFGRDREDKFLMLFLEPATQKGQASCPPPSPGSPGTISSSASESPGATETRATSWPLTARSLGSPWAPPRLVARAWCCFVPVREMGGRLWSAPRSSPTRRNLDHGVFPGTTLITLERERTGSVRRKTSSRVLGVVVRIPTARPLFRLWGRRSLVNGSPPLPKHCRLCIILK